MFPTPDLSFLGDSCFKNVYEPAEDSFLLMDALEKDMPFLSNLQPLITMEIGCGSGVVSVFFLQLMQSQKQNVLHLCIDKNPEAVNAAKVLSVGNKVSLETIQTDLVSGLYGHIKGFIDVLIFNPPYVVTPSDEVDCSGLASSWAGGEKGREVTDRLLPLVPQLLSSKGCFYLVAIPENKIDEIETIMKRFSFVMEVIMSRRSGPEFLQILKFTRSS